VLEVQRVGGVVADWHIDLIKTGVLHVHRHPLRVRHVLVLRHPLRVRHVIDHVVLRLLGLLRLLIGIFHVPPVTLICI